MDMGDATIDRKGLGLSLREYQVLDYLRTHRGRIVPGWELREAVLGAFSTADAERVWVWRVRRKLAAGVIVTVPGMGYRFGLGPVVEAMPRCPRCSQAISRYDDEWVCYGCGARGERKRLEAAVDLEVGRASYAEGSRSGQVWTDEERAFVLRHVEDMTLEEIGSALPEGPRTESAVRGLLAGLGVRKRYVRRPKAVVA